MTPNELGKFIHDVMTPLQGDIKDLQSLFDSISEQIKESDLASNITRSELKTFVTERMSNLHIDLMNNRDSFRGDPGEKGSSGDQGLRGDVGEKGLVGEQGIPGESGPTGLVGDTGDTGLKGERGNQGDQGERGEKGSIGDRGDPGRDGATGEKGLFGNQGIPGTRGDRGEKGSRGDVGQTGKQGIVGKTGKTGKVGAISEWQKGNHVAGEIVTHLGATWQCRRKTFSEPGPISNSWEILSNGISGGEFGDEHKLSINLANGDAIKSMSLKGDKGDKGDSVAFHQRYDETQIYRGDLDEVKESGCVWRATKNGILHKPGSAKAKGQWSNITHRGPIGPAGKDADPEVIIDEVESRLMLRTSVNIENVIKLVDSYFEDADFDV